MSLGTPTNGSSRSVGRSSMAVCRMLIANRSPAPRSRPTNALGSTYRSCEPVMATDSSFGPQPSTMGPTSRGRFTCTDSRRIDWTAAHTICPRFGRQSMARDRSVDSLDNDPASNRSKLRSRCTCKCCSRNSPEKLALVIV